MNQQVVLRLPMCVGGLAQMSQYKTETYGLFKERCMFSFHMEENEGEALGGVKRLVFGAEYEMSQGWLPFFSAFREMG